MQFCLGHPTEGYYMKRDVFGQKGDFITSPEISQTFGELIAVWFISQWERAGRPAHVRLVELGPGRGTLAADMLRTFWSFGDISLSLETLHMVENSEFMRRLQRDALRESLGTHDMQLKWHNDLEEIDTDPSIYTMVVAHEFFDAMPVDMLEKGENGWREIMVDLNRLEDQVEKKENVLVPPSSDAFGFRFAKSEPNSFRAKIVAGSSKRYFDMPEGSRIEVSAQASDVAATLARLIHGGGGGAGLIVDYGDDRVFSDSLRAFKKHKHVDLFETPGECDITANVDFAAMREAVDGEAHAHGPITQRDFLMSMGLVHRLDALLKAAETNEQKASLATAAQRLVDSTGMGSEYKFMAITNTADVPYPFEKPQEASGKSKEDGEKLSE
ncbi:DUF185-domain-containing protein [Calocera cornea HHB12733]|uniref:Protein arginine methyltransferase NDUFAF7 n=1 Tax=Calocera cornea HHB12733 TaxID=1353952 RepID=A0A165DTH7_9BASI|nr:DUF185-domain-containing protein [Calocera cornea HHB12733]